MIWALVRDMYGYGRHFGSFYRNTTILETVSDFDSSSWQLNLSTAQNDFSKFRPGWWQFCWMTGVKFNSIHSILVKFLHITQFTVCAAKNLTVFVADSPRCLEWSSMVACRIASPVWAVRALPRLDSGAPGTDEVTRCTSAILAGEG